MQRLTKTSLVLLMSIPIDVHKAGEKNVLFNRTFNKD
ncbi:hypothetical protein P781_05265 [Vibrio mimicus CAIM 1883]|nr:hypothetical protein P780_05260 [Vibrio mimicus CAIM 1882]ERM59780.1 hypothetical protein P781_05265 [Vibrio mimicus CAIM 1883]